MQFTYPALPPINALSLIIWIGLLVVIGTPLAVGAVLIAAGIWLDSVRRQAETWDLQLQDTLHRSREVRRELQAIAGSLPESADAPFDEPLKRARQEIAHGLGLVENTRRYHSGARVSDVPRRPYLLTIFADPREVFARLLWRFQFLRLRRSVVQAERILARSRLIQVEVAGLDDHERTALSLLQARGSELKQQATLAAYVLALTAEIHRLEAILAWLEQSIRLMQEPNPPAFRVVEAHRLVEKTGRDLEEIADSLRTHAERQNVLRPRLDKACVRLTALQQAVEAEHNRRSLPNLRARVAELYEKWSGLQAALNTGVYDQVPDRLDDINRELQAQEKLFQELLGERTRLAGLSDQISPVLISVNSWLSSVQRPYVMDISRELLRQLQQQLTRINGLLVSEELEQMRQPIPDLIAGIRQARHTFEVCLRDYESLRPRFTPEMVRLILPRAHTAARRLAPQHPRIQVQGRLVLLNDLLTELEGLWEQIRGVDQVLESQFEQIVHQLKRMDAVYTELLSTCQVAEQALAGAAQDYERADQILRLTVLQDSEFVLNNGTPALVERAIECRDTFIELRRRLSIPGEDHAVVAVQAERLRQQVIELSNMYSRELQQTTLNIQQLRRNLPGLQNRLADFGRHAYLDFEARIAAQVPKIETWLGEIDQVPHTSLKPMAAYAERGALLEKQSLVLCREIEVEIQRAEQARLRASQAVNIARASLQRADDALPTVPWISSNPGIDPLAITRVQFSEVAERLSILEKPPVRHSTREALQELQEIENEAMLVNAQSQSVRTKRLQLVKQLNQLSSGQISEQQWGPFFRRRRR